ncbi:D-tagatose 3-epimerase [Paenibacillus konkukensis]|uniref:D-tagatose 3-epimerase n=1 Tax=Paenibacillus konkukensis TaxID=2020716 RepID=A0ABY4RL11_9BACL|nr:sugar phosphate isomerase/epimerase family protein [Paenibacillus konkukensis]UQZ82555.1 D-tagatose 3-epimerase [Paenibacillus konkukensis]
MSGKTNRGPSRPLQVGCCLTAGSFMPQSGGTSASSDRLEERLFQDISGLLEAGYDYAELTVGSLIQLSEEEFDRLAVKMREAGITIPVCNSFIPASLKLTGPEVHREAVESYVDLAMKRVRALGGEMIIFGSGAARTVPEGYPVEQGLEQIKQFLAMCDFYADKYEVAVAIEPLNRGESNIINRVEQALDLAEELQLRHIKVLADAYHMHLEQESPDILHRAAAGNRLAHVHYAEYDRSFPRESIPDGVDIPGLLEALQKSGYKGRISAECMTENPSHQWSPSLGYIRSLLEQAYERGE